MPRATPKVKTEVNPTQKACAFCGLKQAEDSLILGTRGMTLSGDFGAQVIQTTGRERRAHICSDSEICFIRVINVNSKKLMKGEEMARTRAEAEAKLNAKGETSARRAVVTVNGKRMAAPKKAAPSKSPARRKTARR